MLCVASTAPAQDEPQGLSPEVAKAASELLWKTVEHLEGRIPPASPEVTEAKFDESKSPEEQLQALTSLYKAGLIAPEVYHAQRVKLISAN